jgi:CelD/BcsL family acetyltransferase involved in cellulose biosynthesis
MGPGQILTADCIAKAGADGLACYDQLPPLQPYKLQQATSTLPVRDYAISLGAPGALIAAAARSLPEIKSAFGTLPPELRKALMALMGR